MFMNVITSNKQNLGLYSRHTFINDYTDKKGKLPPHLFTHSTQVG